MSHNPERKEKVCLNCNTEVVGRFCHICGQENIEPRQSFWSLVHHFFADITHFDGKFFNTLGYLVRRPGVLSREYINGRRARYLNPIRMYVFTSAVFFIIFFSFVTVDDWNLNINKQVARATAAEQVAAARIAALTAAESSIDSAEINRKFDSLDALRNDLVKDTVEKGWAINLNFDDDTMYATQREYDSAQASKPEANRDGWWERQTTLRTIQINNRYKGRESEFLRDLLDKFFHTFPYLLFVSLPLYALFLKLLYVRKKNFYYVDHVIFLIHLYIFTFIFLIAFFGFIELKEHWDSSVIDIIQTLMVIGGIYYTYRAMKNFYQQRGAKTVVKFILLNLLALMSMTFLFVFFFVITVYRI